MRNQEEITKDITRHAYQLADNVGVYVGAALSSLAEEGRGNVSQGVAEDNTMHMLEIAAEELGKLRDIVQAVHVLRGIGADPRG